jgi:hypothetical protein
MRIVLFFGLLCLLIAVEPTAAPAAAPPRDDADRAIDRALLFLSYTQDKTDGSWRAHGAPNAAVTSLCVMAFLSAGHVPGEGRFGGHIERGVRFILSRQRDDGLITSGGEVELYHHGIAVLMLAEVAGMVEGPLAKQVREAVRRGVAVILKAQRTRGTSLGGWRYSAVPDDQADLSVTGWQVLALRAARNLGCDVPPEAIALATRYVRSCHDPSSGGFQYAVGGPVTHACTGTGILVLELGGKGQHRSEEALRGGGYLRRTPLNDISPYFYYTTYYCAQAMFQLGDDYWGPYRTNLRETVLRKQRREDGSWPNDGHDDGYGPNYCTALAVLTLTVEYRYLPIYQRGEEIGATPK